MNFKEIDASQRGAPELPWTLQEQDIQGLSDAPVQIDSPDGPVIDPEYGMLYGASEDTIEKVKAKAQFLLNSKLYVLVLLRALMHATAGDQDKMDFLIAHCEKEVLQDHGLVPMEKILHVIRTPR